ncbi:SIS domain-containing protein [Scopulibacillus cellulosilyticus]|uniref:SIS domain-containing protein n=1 Tax=Scopulibacillus cellulosilyticus TaxID=2665665 RepID=A0ABW2Q4F4_9BACL
MINTESKFGLNYLEGSILKDGISKIYKDYHDKVEAIVKEWLASGIDQVYFVGCGGSRAIMEPVKLILDKYSSIPADAYTGWEFVNRAPERLNERAAVVLASHSGTTEEVLKSLDLAKERGAKTISFSLNDTPLQKGAENSLVYNTPAVNLAKLFMSYLVTTQLVIQSGNKAFGEELWQALSALPEKLQEIINVTEERGKALAKQYKDKKGYYLVATGMLAGLAYQFKVCTLLEMQWIHASHINAGEFRHGPFEIVEEGQPMIFLLGTDESRPVAERALNFANRYKADTIVFDLKELPEIHPYLAPFGVHIALQWFAWHLAQERDHPLPTRRYMWKVEY